MYHAAPNKRQRVRKAPRSSSNSAQEKNTSLPPETPGTQKVKRKLEVLVDSSKEALNSKKQKGESAKELQSAAPQVKKRRALSVKVRGGLGGPSDTPMAMKENNVKKEKEVIKKEPDTASQGSQPPQRTPRKSSICRSVI